MKTYPSELLLAYWLKGHLSRNEVIIGLLCNMIALERQARLRHPSRRTPSPIRLGRPRSN